MTQRAGTRLQWGWGFAGICEVHLAADPQGCSLGGLVASRAHPERRPRVCGKVLLPISGSGERPEAAGWAPNDAIAFFWGGEENVTELVALMPARQSHSPLLQAE